VVTETSVQKASLQIEFKGRRKKEELSSPTSLKVSTHSYASDRPCNGRGKKKKKKKKEKRRGRGKDYIFLEFFWVRGQEQGTEKKKGVKTGRHGVSAAPKKTNADADEFDDDPQNARRGKRKKKGQVIPLLDWLLLDQ